MNGTTLLLNLTSWDICEPKTNLLFSQSLTMHSLHKYLPAAAEKVYMSSVKGKKEMIRSVNEPCLTLHLFLTSQPFIYMNFH